MAKECFLAFDLGGTHIKSALVDPDGTIIRRKTEPAEGERGIRHVLEKTRHIGWEILRRVRGKYSLKAIGVSFTGFIDPERGVALTAPRNIPDCKGMPIAPMLADAFGVPVRVDNDGLACTVGEWMFGAGKDCPNLVCLTLGATIGSGVILNDRVFRTRTGIGGVLGGQMVVDADGDLSWSGTRGSLESVASETALVGAMRDHLARGSSPRLLERLQGDLSRVDVAFIMEALASSDEIARFVVDRWLDYLGAGIVSLIHAYDPDRVILSGSVMQYSLLILPPLQAYINFHAWTNPKGRVLLQAALLGEDAPLLGAAALVKAEVT